MIFDKARMAKLSGLMTESKGGIDDAMADQFGGGKEEGDPWLDGEVTTEGDMSAEGEMMPEVDDKMGEADKEMDEASLREMIRNEMAAAKKEMEEEKHEEEAVREAVRREIRSVLRSRGVSLGGTGFGFKR